MRYPLLPLILLLSACSDTPTSPPRTPAGQYTLTEGLGISGAPTGTIYLDVYGGRVVFREEALEMHGRWKLKDKEVVIEMNDVPEVTCEASGDGETLSCEWGGQYTRS